MKFPGREIDDSKSVISLTSCMNEPILHPPTKSYSFSLSWFVINGKDIYNLSEDNTALDRVRLLFNVTCENGNENDLECLWDFLETSPEVLSFASKFSEYLSDEVEFGAVFNIDSINIASKAHVHGC
jgi:hypothetical protein